MAREYLFWHAASVADIPSSPGFIPPAIDHQLIAVAGISCTDEIVDHNDAPVVVWASVSPHPATLVERIDQAIGQALCGEAPTVVTFSGRMYGYPVVRANALRTSTTAHAVFQIPDSANYDLLEVFSADLHQKLRFNEMLEVCGLPARLELDVVKAWKEGQKRQIGLRLIADVALLALAFIHRQQTSASWNPVWSKAFHAAILQAAQLKCPPLKQLFDKQGV